MFNIPKLPLEDWVNSGVDYLAKFTGFLMRSQTLFR